MSQIDRRQRRRNIFALLFIPVRDLWGRKILPFFS